MSRIFVRERTRVEKGEKKPRFVLVAAEGVDMDIFTLHARKSELEALAAAVGAEIVYLPRGDKKLKAEAQADAVAEPVDETVPIPEPAKAEAKPKKKKKKK